MSSTRRFAMLAVAAVIAIGAFIALRPNGNDNTTTDRATQTPPSTTTTATATPSAGKPAKTPAPPLLTAAKITELTVKKGETVTFRARSAQDDEIHVHGYDLSKDAPAGQAVRMSFPATIEGIFEIEFENAGRQIAKLTVEP
jgi:heme/copper-type cytochrome/quinol oxidase subunit 2